MSMMATILPRPSQNAMDSGTATPFIQNGAVVGWPNTNAMPSPTVRWVRPWRPRTRAASESATGTCSETIPLAVEMRTAERSVPDAGPHAPRTTAATNANTSGHPRPSRTGPVGIIGCPTLEWGWQTIPSSQVRRFPRAVTGTEPPDLGTDLPLLLLKGRASSYRTLWRRGRVVGRSLRAVKQACSHARLADLPKAPIEIADGAPGSAPPARRMLAEPP